MKVIKYIAAYMAYIMAFVILSFVGIAFAIFYLIVDYSDAPLWAALTSTTLSFFTGIGLRSVLLRKKQ